MGPESFWQLSGAVTGGVAEFAGNLLRIQVKRRIQRRNVAATLAAEVEALCEHATKDHQRRRCWHHLGDP
jgi:hypothetical protein